MFVSMISDVSNRIPIIRPWLFKIQTTSEKVHQPQVTAGHETGYLPFLLASSQRASLGIGVQIDKMQALRSVANHRLDMLE